jgi:Gamma-aminobutyrate permease and related permeases
VVLITAILSTMLASVFGLGRMFRSLADDGFTPGFLKDKGDIPYRGILASGAAMLIGLGIGLLSPSIYVFLISAGGFAMLFTYAVIMATHIRFRKCNGCPPDGKCQLQGFPYTSVFVLVALIGSMIAMPFVPGQASGLVAGVAMVLFFTVVYLVMKLAGRASSIPNRPDVRYGMEHAKIQYSAETSEELSDIINREERE